MPHVALLGDSVFDNRAYVDASEPDVRAQLEASLADDWQVTLLAVDGSMTPDVLLQCDSIPSDCTHLVVSSGGNDALHHAQLLEAPVDSVGHALGLVGEAAVSYSADYRKLLARIAEGGLTTTVCTIYNPSYGDSPFQRAAQAALRMFNDVIVAEAVAAGVDVLDVRRLFVAPEDYANPIEPSAVGGSKLAIAIARIVEGSADRSTRIFGWTP